MTEFIVGHGDIIDHEGRLHALLDPVTDWDRPQQTRDAYPLGVMTADHPNWVGLRFSIGHCGGGAVALIGGFHQPVYVAYQDGPRTYPTPAARVVIKVKRPRWAKRWDRGRWSRFED